MTFEDLNIGKSIQKAIDDIGITEPTAIQAKSFSPIMAGRDVVAIAQTGTGKTFAYLLPILRMWRFTKTPYPQILVVVPTRELVVQVVEEAEKLSAYMNTEVVGVYGGTNMKTQKHRVSQGCDLVVGTPGRLFDLMLDGVLKTTFIKKLIIDEVDEMLNLGFRPQLQNIFGFLPEKRQQIMCSATMTDDVELLINTITEKYQRIEAAPSGAPLENIRQSAYNIPNFLSKLSLLKALLDQRSEMTKVLVFLRTKRFADALYERLSEYYPEQVGVIHSSKSQNFRFNSVEQFQNGSVRMLIATDLIARGLDLAMVTHVVNFDLTDVAEKYVHRIGRTGRAHEEGVAISFVSDEEQKYKLEIEELMGQKIEMHDAYPEGVELTEEIIPLEHITEHVPFNNHKMKGPQITGESFHEKKDKNKKVNVKIRYVDKMKAKYGKAKTRGSKSMNNKKKKKKK